MRKLMQIVTATALLAILTGIVGLTGCAQTQPKALTGETVEPESGLMADQTDARYWDDYFSQ